MSIITIEDFLRDRGVAEEALTHMKEQKIDRDVILLIDDTTLANYIPSYGDIIALFNFCRNQKPAAKRKLGLFEKLREKMKLRKDTNEAEEEPKSSNTKCRSKQYTRSIEIGWIHTDKETKQVRTKQGGGTRKVQINISAGHHEILKEGKSLFFPNGQSSKGKESEFSFEVWDFKQNVLADDVTIGTIYDTVKLPKLRFYIATKSKEDDCDSSSESGHDVNSNLESEDNYGEFSVESEHDGDDTNSEWLSDNQVSTNRQITTYQPVATNGQVAAAQQVATDQPVATNRRVAPREHLITDRLVVPDHNFLLPEVLEDYIIVQAYTATVADSDPEITFGPNTVDIEDPWDLEVTEIYQPDQTPEHASTTKMITIHHANSFNDMIEAFSDPEILTTPLMFRRLLPDNSEEAGSGSGVLRDVYSTFWQEFYDRCTLGTTQKVPFIRHDFKAGNWKAVGRIFVRGYKDCNYLPIKIAHPFVEELLFGEVYSDLIETFLQFVSEQEREVITQALKDFTSVEQGELMEVLDNYQCRKRVTANTFREILIEISHKEFVQKPQFVIDCWREVTKPQISMKYEELTKMYADLKPTPKKVLGLLKFPAGMTTKQKEIEHHLKRYLRELNEEKLGKFLRFCTGSDLILSDSVSVQFSVMTDFTRRPIGRTCGMFLEVPESYENFPDFRTEFNAVLESNIWVMDIV